MAHQHIYDENGKQICCTEEEKINAAADKKLLRDEETEASTLTPENTKTLHQHTDDDGHDHSSVGKNTFQMFLPAIFSFLLLSSGLIIDHYITQNWFSGTFRIIWYIAAYLPVGLPVLQQAVLSVTKGAVFSEFLLMSIATIGGSGKGGGDFKGIVEEVECSFL